MCTQENFRLQKSPDIVLSKSVLVVPVIKSWRHFVQQKADFHRILSLITIYLMILLNFDNYQYPGALNAAVPGVNSPWCLSHLVRIFKSDLQVCLKSMKNGKSLLLSAHCHWKGIKSFRIWWFWSLLCYTYYTQPRLVWWLPYGIERSIVASVWAQNAANWSGRLAHQMSTWSGLVFFDPCCLCRIWFPVYVIAALMYY